jgi:hypothetical protein
MVDFKQWWNEQHISCGEGGMDAAEIVLDAAEMAFDAAVNITAKRCKEITQQRYLAKNQAVEIDSQISKEFGV